MSIISFKTAVELLQNEAIVAIPTETVYGLAARMDSVSAIDKVFLMKGRPKSDPLIVHICKIEDADNLVISMPALAQFLATRFMPGPLTLLLPKNPAVVSDLVTSGSSKVAIRCPNHPMTLKLIEEVGVPLVAPSANRFGKTSPTSAEHVESEFEGMVPVLASMAACNLGIESTLLEIDSMDSHDECKLIIHRPGPITDTALLDAVDEFCKDHPGMNVIIDRNYDSKKVPGSFERHYCPTTPLFILEKDPAQSLEVLQKMKNYFQKDQLNFKQLELSNEAERAAKNLYAQMRENSELKDCDFQFVVKPTEDEFARNTLWHSIWNRVLKASTPLM